MIFYSIVLLFVLSFSKGALELLGISEAIIQLIIDVLIIIVFSYSLLIMVKNKRIKGPGLVINFILFAVILSSFLLSDVSEIQMILFIRKFGIYYLFFYALFNINLSDIQKDKLLKLLMILFLIQIPAAFIKLIMLGGTQEKIIGAMSVQSGSIATIMPIIAISYLVASYLELKKIKDLVLILLFIAIGLISNKMGILFYVMLLFVSLSYFYSLKHTKGFNLFNMIFIKKMMMVSVILIFIFLAFVSLNPRANPEGIVGGSVDIDYLVNYIDDYQNLKYDHIRIEGEGRFDAPGIALDRMSSQGWFSVLLGFGPGDIIKSSFTPYENPLREKYNIGYGGRLGLVWIMMQLGLVGVVVLLLFHFVLFERLWRVYRRESKEMKDRVLVLGVLGLPVIFMLDFFTYSSVLMVESGITITYYFAIFYVLTIHEKRDTLRNTA